MRDFAWGEESGGLIFGLWASRHVLATPERVHLRAAVKNLSMHPASLCNDFLLEILHDGNRAELGMGPRSTQPVVVGPGDTQVILGWRFAADEFEAGDYAVRLLYHSPDGRRHESDTLRLQILPRPPN